MKTSFVVSCLLILLLSGFRVTAQSVRGFSDAESYGASMLKEMERENVAHPMQYEVLSCRGSFKKLLKSPYTVYEIKSDYDLNSEVVEIPDHCVLVFNGGSLRNGKIIGKETKYCSKTDGSKCLKCDVGGTLERIGYVVKASERGMVKNSEKKAKQNVSKLNAIVDQGENLYLDGTYYFDFSDPVVLRRVFWLFGGELVYERNAFHFSDSGGLVLCGASVVASKKSRSAFFCGSNDLLGSVTIKNLSFYGCTVDCGYLVNVLFKDMNSDEVSFGVNHIEVDHCVFKETGRVRIMDAVIDGSCVFKNNYYKRFTTTPVYIACQHSVQASPNDKSAYQHVFPNLTKGCPVIIDHNIFKGTPVELNFYYCSALIKAVDCHFTNNYLQDIINSSDGSIATAYDAYLSCVNVVYENNFVKDMMSFSRKGSSKPQCQIGKSKTNPLAYWKKPSKRIYRNNIFLVDGERFLKMGADASSLSADIFGNNTYIDDYIWENNTVIFKQANLKTGVASNSYGTFRVVDNYFEADKAEGSGLVTVRSKDKVNEILIKGNSFKLGERQLFPLFNQKYNEDYRREDQGRIVITDNTFENCSPKVFFFTGEQVVVKNNASGDCSIDGNLYLSKFSGSGTVLDVKEMDAELVFRNQSENTGGLMQYFSSDSKGEYSVDLDHVPEKGVNYYYSMGLDHGFVLKLEIIKGNAVQQIKIPFQLKKGKLSYEWEGKNVKVPSGKSDSKVWYKGDGIQLKTTFYVDEKNQMVTRVLPSGALSSDKIRYRFSFESE